MVSANSQEEPTGLVLSIQHFSLHENSLVQEAARDGIEAFTRASFNQYLKDDLGMAEE